MLTPVEPEQDMLALEKFLMTAEKTPLWDLIKEDLSSDEAEAYFERIRQDEESDWAALRCQIVGQEDESVL